MSDEGRLTPKQRIWLAEYLGGARFNATEAARRAGYKDAEVSGLDNKQNPVVAARVREVLSAQCLSSDEVLAELRDVATAEWRDFLTIKTDPRTGATVDVRMDLSNKVKALELLGKAHGIFTDRVDISGSLTSRVELVGITEDDI